MKLNDPELIDRLAAEYVLGTLRGPARRRFERHQREDWHVGRRVGAWEDRLTPFALALAPQAPSPALWPQIARRIGIDPTPARLPPARAWSRALAAGLAAVALFFGGWFALRTGFAPDLQPVATIAEAGGDAVWRVETDRDHSRVSIAAIGVPRAAAGRSYELWALPEDGSAPVSLGLMPASGVLERSLAETQRAALGRSAKVAVSLEPAGGSPTGAPTGPVLYVAELQRPAAS
jgi:anti-sigma-K factor RskA